MTDAFSQLALDPRLLQTLTAIGHNTPTPIQSAVIPAMLAGQDIIGQSQTGTGKTAAFALPILHHLVTNQRSVQALVVTPTRELAMQVAQAIRTYGSGCGVKVLPVYGGEPYHNQIRSLKKGIDIVVGTPGRLLDLINKKVLKLGDVSTVVLDEADEMLSLGFIGDVEAILEETAASRQTALFSATLPQRIRRLADRYMRTPQSFTIGRGQLTVASIEQRHYIVNAKDKQAALTRLFEVEPISSALVFVRTRIGTGELANELAQRGFSAEALNGDLSQEARVHVLKRFRDGKIKVLVATDVAARGLDIDDISHVFNYDLPQDPEVYVHRIGRTGRAGKTGIAISLLAPNERWFLRKIESYVKHKLTASTLPTVEEIHRHREAALVEKIMVWLRRGRCSREREIVAQLAADGFESAEVAAIALKLVRAKDGQRPIAPISEVKTKRLPQTRSAVRRRSLQKRPAARGGKPQTGYSRKGASQEKGMVRLALNTGNANGIHVKHIVGTLARFADIPGRSLGRIDVQEQHSYVDVPEKLVGQVLAKTANYKIGRQRVSVELA